MTARIANSGKDTWTTHLPKHRRGATGRLADRIVFLLVVSDRDGRFIRVELPSEHARALAADLIQAADRAEIIRIPL